MQTRRSFIRTTLVGAAALPLFNRDLFSAPATGKLEKFGFISGIIGKDLEGDWKSVLKKTVEYGFSEIETGEFMGNSLKEYLAYLDEIGLSHFAAGIGFNQPEDELQKSLDNVNALKAKYAVTYWPWTGGAPFSLEDCKKSSEILNRMGEICHKNGLILCWHNHNNEFRTMEEGMPFDYLMAHTDKDLVKCEMDIYWVKKGGSDPLEVLKKHKGRIEILHVKDMAPGPEQDFICPGRGIIDFPSVFAEAQNQGIKHYIVERDNEPDGMGCLKSSGEYLKNLRF
jgi:sugar phosphate isomerase/epimerase